MEYSCDKIDGTVGYIDFLTVFDCLKKIIEIYLSNFSSKWHSNPLFRGCYSCYTLKAEALGASVQKLAQPINDSNGRPVIQFAGEATSPQHYSTVHGAVESGWREAERLINLYK